MTPSEFRGELKNGLGGAYFFFGEEEYLKKFYADRAEKHTLGEDSEMYDWNFYSMGKADDPEIPAFGEAVFAVPMMGDRVFIKYRIAPSSLKKDEIEKIRELLSSVAPEQTVALLICDEGTFDSGNLKRNKPSSMYKAFAEHCKMVNFEIQTPSEIKKWMQRRLARDKVTIDAAAAESLMTRCGKNMFYLAGEIDKLSAYAAANGIPEINGELIDLVCFASEEEDAFALANAVLAGDRRRALSVLHMYKMRRESAVKIMSMITRSICDMTTVSLLLSDGADKGEIAKKMGMHEYRAGLFISAVCNTETGRLIAAAKRCREADIKLKTSSLDYIAIERFICTIPVKRR